MSFWRKEQAPKPSASAAQPDARPPIPLVCSFCQKRQQEVRKLIAGPSAHICDECIQTCNDIMASEAAKDAKESEAARPELPSAPHALARRFDAVIGQAAAKRALAAALYQQLLRVHQPEKRLRVPRILLAGPRGSGKSTLARALAAATTLPSYHADVSRLTETGYVGENVENLLGLLLERAPTQELAHAGLLFLDGLHHIARRVPPENSRRDISGGEVQRELVRLLDGLPSQVQRDGSLRHPQASSEAFPCDRLMIAAALTVDLGPAASSDRTLRDALIAQGLDDELLSRFDVIVRVGRLDAAELAEVLIHPETGIAAPTRALIEALGGRLDIMPDGAEALAAAAAADPDGAWALLRPLARLAERALEAEPRSWILDRDLARTLEGA